MKKNIVVNLLVQLLILNSANSTAAIIGGGDAGVARECISKGFNLIDWYELDPEVVKACYKYLPKISSRVRESNSIKTVSGEMLLKA